MATTLRVGFVLVVAGEHGAAVRVEDLAVRRDVVGVGRRDLATRLGATTLLGHSFVEAGAIEFDAALLGDLGRDLDRKAERVVQQERDLAPNLAGRQFLFEHGRAVAQGLAEPHFFALDGVEDRVLAV